MSENLKVAVIGTGISGLSIAQMLKQHYEVTLFERSATIGGLIKCERVQDCLFHKVGGHVFNSKNKDVLNWFWKHFDRKRSLLKRREMQKFFFGGRVIGYPIENYIYLFDKPTVKKIFSELLLLNQSPKLSPFEYDNFESFLRNNFGNTLFELYFQPYNEKIWRTDLSQVAMEWLEGKLPMPNLEEIVLSNIVKEDETNMVHSEFYYPKVEGSQFIVNRLSQGLTINTDVNIKETSKANGNFSFCGYEGFDKIIYCGDIRRVPDEWKALLREKGVDVAYLEQLKSNGTSNLLCETDDTDISWLYIPENFTRAHRIIYTGNFSPTNNRGSNRKTCTVEFSGKVSYEDMEKEIKKLPGNLTPLSFNYEENSYVIQDKRTRTEIAAAKEVLEKEGIYLLGRFAEWEYYNMDKCIEAAFQIAAKLGVS